jgi:hypothetical protein
MSIRTNLARSLALALTLAAAGSLAAAPARAWERVGNITWADGQLVDVQVRVAGSAAPLYLSPQGDSRRYFQAYAGRNYSLVLRNNSAERVGVLISVDGLNVVSGSKSGLRGTEPMYVLGPYESATIDGWRTSLNDIRRFVFVDEARSYASRTGQANGDMGWIRVLAFREQQAFWQPRGKVVGGRQNEFRGDNAPRADKPLARDERSEPMAAAPAPTQAQGELSPAPQAKGRSMNTLESDQLSDRRDGGSFPGTGWGEHQNDRVERVAFTAERRATDTLVFRYEYAGGLRALGIFPDRDRLRDRDNGELGFAKPPRW